MTRNIRTACIALAAIILSSPGFAKVNVVCSLETYAALAREVGGNRLEVRYICRGNQDAHFIKPKPSYSVWMKSADLLVSTGLDLELWLPALVDRSGNRRIRSGQPGYVSAAAGLTLLDKPAHADRSQGDVHIFGNPHIHTSPLNAKLIAANIATGLKKVDPAHAAEYDKRLHDFQARIDRALFGKPLVDLLGGRILTTLTQRHRLLSFLKEKHIDGRLGGWLKQALPARGKPIVCYHKNWIYFTDLFGLKVVDYIEPKPGIPPTPAHVNEVIQKIKQTHAKVIWTANYFEASKPAMVAGKTGARAVRVPIGVGGDPGVDDYFDLVDLWVKKLTAALS